MSTPEKNKRYRILKALMFIASVVLGISAIIGISIEVHDRIEKGRYNKSSLQKELDLNNCVFKSKVETGKEMVTAPIIFKRKDGSESSYPDILETTIVKKEKKEENV